MLLEFRTKNFKSFQNEMIFSMQAAPKQKGMEYSLLKGRYSSYKTGKALSKKIEALSSAVIYGANASGKTNIVSAIDAFKTIILRGNIDNSDTPTLNPCTASLELIPNKDTSENKPVSFAIKFFTNDLLFSYETEIDFGGFLQNEYDRKIVSERLFINDAEIFDRTGELRLNLKYSFLKQHLTDFSKRPDEAVKLAREGLSEKEFFLVKGFSTIVSPAISSMIQNYFKKMDVIVSSNQIEIQADPKKIQNNIAYIDAGLTDIAKEMGITSNAIGPIKNDNGAEICSFFQKESKAVPIKIFESYGTCRFINLFPIIARSLKKGSPLIVDEFDVSLHPFVLINIVNIYHNDEINKNKAQLIFNTHNPIFLNKNIFRRDEIKFVERDDETHGSTHYALSDFGTEGKKGVRKTEDYMKNYFINKYGAIRSIDFTSIFQKLMDEVEPV